MVAEKNETLRNGHAEGVSGSAALGVASKGLRTIRNLANFTVAHSLDVLRDRIGCREANTSLRAISETRKLIVDGQKVGYDKDVIDAPGGCDGSADMEEERQLTARLEAIRERRCG